MHLTIVFAVQGIIMYGMKVGVASLVLQHRPKPFIRGQAPHQSVATCKKTQPTCSAIPIVYRATAVLKTFAGKIAPHLNHISAVNHSAQTMQQPVQASLLKRPL